MPEIVYLIVLSLTSVVYLFIIAKLLGKRQISQLDFMDYAIGISIGSIAADMSIDTTDHPIYFYLIAMTIFFLFDVFITFIGRKGVWFKRFLKGRPLTIIYEGKIRYRELKKSKLDINDLMAMCRELGYFDLSDIYYAIFENSGKLSVLPVSSQKNVTPEDLKIDAKEPSLPINLIIDGKVSFSSLSEIGKDVTWLEKRLNIKEKKGYDEIILAIYDGENDEIIANYKNQ